VSVSLAGYFFGQIEIVKKHFELVVLAIVFISVVPVIVHALKSRRKAPGFEPVMSAPGAGSSDQA
jgi:membrane-associated protein